MNKFLPALLLAVMIPFFYPPLLPAQEGEDIPIFQRFSNTRQSSPTRLTVFELPVALRPQNYSDAEIEENLGLGYFVAVAPQRQVFSSFGFSWGRMEIRPTNPEVDLIDIKQVDVTQNLNFWLWRTFTVSLGAGLGIMDSLVMLSGGGFEHEVVPYIPLRIGLAIPIGRTVTIALTAVLTPFLGSGAGSGSTRLMLGVGLSL